MDHQISTGAATARRTAGLLVGMAAAWGIALLALACWLPIVTEQSPVVATPTAPGALTELPRVSLVRHDGYGVLWLVLLPLLVTLLVGLLLRTGAAERSRAAALAAWGLALLVVAGGLAGLVTFLIGGAVVPVGLLLVGACAGVVPPSSLRGR